MSNQQQTLNPAQLATPCIPWWRLTGIAISQTNVALNIFNLASNAQSRYLPPASGRVVGVSLGADANLTAGTLTISLFIANALAASVTITNADSLPVYKTFATPQAFTSAQSIDFRYSSDAAVATLSIIQVIPNIIYDA